MTGKLWPLLSGFAIWAIAFVALYAVQALGCAWGWQEALHRTILLAIWIATIGILCLLLLWQWRQPAGSEPSMRRNKIMATTAALAATLLTYFPITFATLCV